MRALLMEEAMDVTPSAVLEKRINQLEESVVNQIAAGEVIQRPSSALKELLENAIDAGATQISVTVKDGGLKLLQITDNGGGIHKDDLPILCHRHTTSKLVEYADLASISTLGFRGEALCSVSFVSRFTVTTMRPDEEVGWKVSYRDSEMLSPGPEPTAAVPGTSVLVEDLFYNVPNRRKAMGSASEEYNRIWDVVAKYSVYCTGVGLSLKRAKEVRADVHTAAAFSRRDAIRSVYGASVASHILPLSLRCAWPAEHQGQPESLPEDASFSVEGFISTTDHSVKKTTLILFINGRLVECAPLKRALEAVYAGLYAKASRCWVFLDVRMPSAHIDVNVHPTKSEVAFLHQTEFVEGVRDAAERLLMSSHDVRTFARGSATAVKSHVPVSQQPEEAGKAAGSTQRSKAGGDHKLVRTDHRAASLQPFLLSNPVSAPAAALAGSVRRRGTGTTRKGPTVLGDGVDMLEPAELRVSPNTGPSLVTHLPNPPPVNIPAVAIRMQPPLSAPLVQEPLTEVDRVILTVLNSWQRVCVPPSISAASYLCCEPHKDAASSASTASGGDGRDAEVPHEELLAEVDRMAHTALTRIVREHTFVGHIDGGLALLQQSTKLFVVDIAALSRDLMYQQALARCGAMKAIVLEDAPSLEAIVLTGLDAREAAGLWVADDGPKNQLASMIKALLVMKADLLRDCFGVDVSPEGRLLSLPMLIESYCPDLTYLPQFFLALAGEVDWLDETRAFHDLATALADLYAVKAPPATYQQRNGASDQASDSAADPDAAYLQPPSHSEWLIQHVILSAMRQHLKVSHRRATDGTAVQVAALEQLYRVFERC